LTILVTGGAGFIGSHLVERLLASGRRIVCIDNFDGFYDTKIKRRNVAAALANRDYALCEGDICDEAFCRDVFAREKPEQIVHLAARAGVRPSIEEPLLYERVNCLGTVNLLELARRSGVSMFVFGSSSSIYGESAQVPFSEDFRGDRPISPYAATKRACELYAHTYHHLYGLPVTCLRFFTVYGPRQRPDLAIHKFTKLIESGKPIPVFGDGSTSRDYTYFSDICDGIVAALERPMGYEIINLGNSSPITLASLIGLIEKSLGKNAVIDRRPLQPGDVSTTYADISKAKRLLGYEPKFPIERGIQSFVEWYRETNSK